MCCNHDFFTAVLRKDEHICLPFNMSVLCIRDASNWIRSWDLCGSSWNIHNPTSHSLHPQIDSFPFPCLNTTHFLSGFAFFPVAGICSRKCHSVSLLGGGSVDGWPCTGWGTTEPCFSTRPCASKSLNFSASIFLFSGSDRYMTTALCIATLSSLLNNFRYHLEPFFHSSKYGCNIWSFRSTPPMWTL
jgi:hypothetical protein